MLSITLVQIATVTLLVYEVRAEVFTAVVDIEPLLQTHTTVISSLELYLLRETERLNMLQKYLNSYKKEQSEMEKDIMNYAGNPINMFTLIKRLSADFETIEWLVKTNSEFEKNPHVTYPTKEDLEGAAEALSRLQTTYNLEINQLAQGVLNGTFSHGNKRYTEKTFPITANDCFEIARSLYDARDLKVAVEWFLVALDKHYKKTQEDIFNTVPENTIVEFIRSAYHELKDFNNSLIWTKRLLDLTPDQYATLNPFIEYYEQALKAAPSQPDVSYDTEVQKGESQVNKLESIHNDTNISTYESLCRGELPVPNYIAKSLHCVYTKGPHPFLMLAPIKTEQLSSDPGIFLFHDVSNDREIEILKYLAKPRMQRAKVNVYDSKPMTAKYRISKSGTLHDSWSPTVKRISRRVSHITGLSIETAEQLQVANYGIGGHFIPHCDFFQPTQYSKAVGNRIATVLFYMSDVEQGGATVFVDLKLTVFPVKHAALFWMNLHASGEPDYRTSHAACPVLRGSKWVSTKWLHSVSQEFLRPCT